MRKLSLANDDTLVYRIRFASPVHLGSGVENTPSDFFRVASLRGALRFWYRAMVGAQDLKSLKRGEANIFGDTEQGSKVILRAEGSLKGGIKFAVSRPKGKSAAPDGNGYMGYSFHKTNKTPERYPLEIKKDIYLRVYFRNCSEDERIKAEAAIWLALHFGGVGMRSRRGYGSIQGEIVLGTPLFQGLFNHADRNELEKNMINSIGEIMSFSCFTGNGMPSFPVIAPDYFLFAIFKNESKDCRDALNLAGSNYFNWRIGDNYKAPNRRGSGIDQKREHKNRRELGLPITGGPSGRLASPLIFHLHRLGNGKTAVVAGAFKYAKSGKGLAQEFLKYYLQEKEIADYYPLEGDE
ncbi:MAG: type III-B CRISPR module RAMP protein Cmr1 [bacterium]